MKAAAGRLTVSTSTSTSTQHVPHDVVEETQLPGQLRSWLAFSDQKAVEVKTLASYLAEPASARAAIDEATAVIASRATAEGVRRADVRARTLLPLKKADHADYLKWSVDSFRLATAGAADATQIHTHLCYSEFGVIIDAIDGLDADVTSIEAAWSRMEVVHDLESHGFGRGVGPGVYDIHSPRVPGTEEATELLGTAVKHVPTRQLWVNPDCGLKTRGYTETEESLRNLVEATRTVRAGLLQAVK